MIQWLAQLLWGPVWVVTVREPGIGAAHHRVRARHGFDAEWKVASELHRTGDPQFGYLAFKWMNNLQLDEGERVKAELAS